MKRAAVVLGMLVVLAVAGVLARRFLATKRETGAYRLAKVERGDLVQTVRATGVVQPLRLVQVGTQVNGPVQKLYVDYNDRVEEGDLVAQIDPTVYEARLAQDQANLAQSLASVEQAQARLAEAEKELARARQLAQREMLSQSELDSAVANRDTLAAQVKVAQAAVEQARASLRVSKANLDYTTIRSPVSGVVIARNVSEGQTVVASLSAQVLFTIATDLRQVQVEASIPEADIGRIRVGQPVAFTVDAYEQVFTGRVEQVRLAAATVQNVVTYPVVVRAENPEGRLFPGMTANIVCEVARREGALKVPNAALRFKPEEAAEAGGGPPRESRTAAAGPHVWVPEGKEGRPRPVAIGTGISDGSFTEVREPSGVSAGQAVITGRLAKGERASDTVNPFTPRFPREARRAAR